MDFWYDMVGHAWLTKGVFDIKNDSTCRKMLEHGPFIIDWKPMVYFLLKPRYLNCSVTQSIAEMKWENNLWLQGSFQGGWKWGSLLDP